MSMKEMDRDHEDAPRVAIDKLAATLRLRGVEMVYVPDRRAALQTVLQRLPRGAAVAHGSSTTLHEIGLVDVLKRPDSEYRYMNAEWLAENDALKRRRLRGLLSLEADYYLGGVQAICESGEVIGADLTGSRQAFYVFGPPHVIWVAGVNKIVPDVGAGVRRVREVALPLEDERIRSTGGEGSYIGKLVIYERERPGRLTLILVGEALGY